MDDVVGVVSVHFVADVEDYLGTYSSTCTVEK